MRAKAWRKKAYDILEARDPSTRSAGLVTGAIQILIVLNVFAVILESVPSIEIVYGHALSMFEIMSVLCFTAEYIFRVWCTIDSDDPRFMHPVWGRLRYMITPFAVIDLLVLLPAYVGFFGGADLRTLRVVRLLRLLKLMRYSKSLSLLVEAMREEARAVGATAFILSILLITAASLAYLFEHPSQPDAFSSIPQAMWWAIVTMTTVGYGDITPVTIPGKVVAAVVSIIGIGMVALPAGLIAAGFVNRLHDPIEDAEETPNSQEPSGGQTQHLKHVLSELGANLPDSAIASATIDGEKTGDDCCPFCGSQLEPEQKSQLEHRLSQPTN